MESKTVDFLIIGAGLSGSILAKKLTEQNKSCLVIDNELKTSSSTVAAGVTNPLVFRRLNYSWNALKLIPEAQEFYTSLEKEFSESFFTPILIKKFYYKTEEINNWEAKKGQLDYNPFMGEIETVNKPFIKGEAYTATVKNASWLNVPKFLRLMHQELKANGQLVYEEFLAENLILGPTENTYTTSTQTVKAKHVLFCQGVAAQNNSFFGWTPLKPVKGEVLTVKSNAIQTNSLLNKNCFVLPVGDKTFRLGATYDFKNLNYTPTAEGKQELLEKFNEFLVDPNLEITEHKAGIRPTTRDRRPIIGTHPEFKNLHFFNGLGSKGVMIAPWLAKVFVDYILHQKELPSEVDLKRFYKFYQNS